MRSSRTVVPTFLLVLGLVVAGAPADAQTRFGISGFTGYQSYAMDDINEVIADVNDELSSPGTLVQIEELTGDPSFGLGLKLDLGKTWRVYGEYEHLSDDTGGGNLIGSFNIDADADAFLLGATYFLPSSGKARVGIGAGVGMYEYEGVFETSGTVGSVPFSGSQTADGSTIGFHARADLDVAMSGKLHFDAALGYRGASGELEQDGQGTGVDLDWSGFMTRAGFTFFLN